MARATGLDYDMLMSLPPREGKQSYSKRDTMLYALGLGVGARAAEDSRHLQYVYEEGLKVLPTMAIVLAYPGFWVAEPQYGIDYRKVLHADQSLELVRPLPVEGNARSQTTVQAIYDKGPDKGALMYIKRELFDAATDELIANVRQGLFLRGNGGFGGRSDGAPVPHPTPDRRADSVFEAHTREEQALIYRLSGDYNPLHAAPAAASEAGFPKPILHGLATFGVAGWGVITQLCGADPQRLRRLDARFSSPVFPGEILRVEIWRDAAGRASFQVRVVERDVVVLKNGYVEYEEP
jgi:acyl dehydratase